MPCPEALRADVLAHARAEEQHGVARLTTEGAPSRLRWMTAAMEAAEALASTRPAQASNRQPRTCCSDR